MSNYGVKNLYQGALLAYAPITINGKNYEENDVILFFDDIQEIAFQEQNSAVSATGGYHNRPLISWDITEEINCELLLGTISKLGYGLVNKAVLKSTIPSKAIRQFEKAQVDKSNKIHTKHPIDQDRPLHLFSLSGQSVEKEILDFSIEGNTISLEENFDFVFVDYYFKQEMDIQKVWIGDKVLNGFFKFVGKFYYTDEQTGVQKTALIEIPKLSLNSSFSIDLGRNVNPSITTLSFTAIPNQKNSRSISISYLTEDIDGDF